MESKSILIDVGHPAHVHLFKNLIFYLKEREHSIIVTSRNKDVTEDLLDHYGIDFISLSTASSSKMKMLFELFKRDRSVIKLNRKYRFRIAIGTSVSIAHLSAFTRVPSFVFEEDDDEIIASTVILTYPFATHIVVPSCLKFRRWTKKRIIHNSYHELAYLHPDVFSPDVSILEKYGLEPSTYVIFRNSAMYALHDVRQKGMGNGIGEELMELLKGYRILSSAENTDKQLIAPWDMHHVLSFARMLISDSQTMTAEAACLGVPSVRYNTFVGRISYLEELESRYGLTFGFRPGEERSLFQKVSEILDIPLNLNPWKDKRERMLSEKDNLNEWMIKTIEPYLA
ncbi:MAG: DUF354 domain-containing protein [Acidobacteriota bacterium]